MIGLSLWYLTRTRPLAIQGEVQTRTFDLAARVDGRVAAIPVQRSQDVARGADPTGDLGKALANCQNGTGDYGIPFMTKYLTDAKVSVPPSG